MTKDKYTKFILTLIAVGVLGLNFYLYSGGFIKEAKAELNSSDLRDVERGLDKIANEIRNIDCN